MFSLDELRRKIGRCVAGALSVSDFEDWFSIESWNVHQWGSADEIDLVFSIEALFSRHHFESLEETELRMELAKSIRPFAQSARRVSAPLVEFVRLKPGRQPYHQSSSTLDRFYRLDSPTAIAR